MKSLFLFIAASLIISTTFGLDNEKGLKIGKIENSSLTIQLKSKKSTTASITITSQAGLVISTQIKMLTTGINHINLIDVSTLLEGTYTIKITQQGKTMVTSFVNLKMDNF